MTFRNYRNSLYQQMLSYLRYMKYAETDQQLFDLNTEVSELRIKVHNLDQLTESQMLEVVNFKDEIFKSYGVTGVHIIKNQSYFRRDITLTHIRKKFKSKKSEYLGVHHVPKMSKWRAKLTYKSEVYLNSYFMTEKEAVRNRDLVIIKHNLPLPLQILKNKKNGSV